MLQCDRACYGAEMMGFMSEVPTLPLCFNVTAPVMARKFACTEF